MVCFRFFYFFDMFFLFFLRRNRWPPVALTPAMCPVYLGFLLLNMARLGRLWRSCVLRSSMKSEVQRTRTITTTPTTVPQISCPQMRLRSPRTSVEIARREIQVWKSQTILLPKTSNPHKEWHRSVKIFPWLFVLVRRVLAIPVTSDAPERLFSTSCNTMTKKRCSLSCDHLEECVYLHETWTQVRKWAADKKVHDMN